MTTRFLRFFLIISTITICMLYAYDQGCEWAENNWWIRQEPYYLRDKDMEDWTDDELLWWMDEWGMEYTVTEYPRKNWRP